MKRTGLGRVAVLAAAVALVVPAVAQGANEVTKWNEIAVNTMNAEAADRRRRDGGAVFVAMVQGAVYGAVNAVDRHGKPYLINRSFPKASAEAAAATAAYRVLSALFPSGALDTAYAASLQDVAPGEARTRESRSDRWRPTRCSRKDTTAAWSSGARSVPAPPASGCRSPGPAGPLCDPSPWVADAKPFVLNSPSQFRTAGPYALTSAQWAADFNEVKSLARSIARHAPPSDSRCRFLADEPGGELQRPRAQVRRPVLARAK